MENKKLAIISIILAALFVGGTGAFSKIALHTIPPLTFTFLRFLVGSVAITPFFLKDKTRFHKPTLAVILLSFIQVLNTTAYSFGIRLTTATIGQTLFVSVSIITAIVSYILVREIIGLRKGIGVFVGFLGTLIIVLLPVFGKQSAFNGNLLGNLLVFISVFCLSIYSVLSKKFHNRYSPTYLTAIFVYATTITNALLTIPELSSNHTWITKTSVLGWIGIIYVGTFGVLFFLLYQAAVKYGSALMASTINYLSPITAFCFASILLGERLTIGFLIGAAVALSGVYLVNSSKPIPQGAKNNTP